MKKTAFSILSMLAIAAISLFSVSCGGSDKDNNKENPDSLVLTPGDTSKVAHEGFASSINIRYVDMDSILANYDYAVQEMQKIQQKALELQQYQNTLSAQLQKKQNEIQQKVNSNSYLSQESYEKDMRDLQALGQTSETNYAKRAQSFDNEAARVQQTLIQAIDNYIIKYNQDKHYDAILHKAAGAYFNPALDITGDIIEGLNAQSQAASGTQN